MAVQNGIIVADSMVPASMHASPISVVPEVAGDMELQPSYLRAYPSDPPTQPIRVGQGYAPIGKPHNGIIPFGYGRDVLFYKIWFEPVEIDAGFIVEETDYNIKIWNTFFDGSVQLTAVSGVSTAGTGVTYDSLPITINTFGDYWVTLTVYEEGPPVQSTDYTFTIDGYDWITEVEGIRVVPVPWEPDWDSKIRFEYHFDTVLATNKYFVEQRRPLRYKPYMKANFQITGVGVDGQKLKQSITYGHDKVFGVPIFSEQGYPSSDFNSSATIQCSNDLSILWNLNNLAEYVIVVDHFDLTSEIKAIDSIGTNQVVCQVPITRTFSNWQRCVVYPVVMCTAESIASRAETDEIFRTSWKLLEYERATSF
jgi:hypothetical protein